MESSLFTTNNSLMIWLTIASILMPFILMIILFNISKSKNIQKFFLPGLIVYLILLFPIFVDYNLYFIFNMQYENNILSGVLLFIDKLIIFLDVLHWVLITIFIRNLYDTINLSSSQKILIWIPLINIYTFYNLFRELSKSKIRRFPIFYLIAILMFSYGLLIMLVALLFNLNIYDWYLLSSEMNNTESMFTIEDVLYTNLAKLIDYSEKTVLYYSAFFSLLGYIEFNKLKKI